MPRQRLRHPGLLGHPARLALAIFSPVGEDRQAAAPICTPDFGHFTKELERMGFKRRSAHGEHGRWTYDAFDRPGQHVEVCPRVAEGVDAAAACVHMVLVR